MFGGSNSNSSSGAKPQQDGHSEATPGSPNPSNGSAGPSNAVKATEQVVNGEKRSGNGSPENRQDATEKKRRSSSVSSKASSFLASAKNSLSFSPNSRSSSEMITQTPLQKLGKQDPELVVPQGKHNNAAGDSLPGPNSTFNVGVWEDKNKKCRRTMEDTHAFLYNFLDTPVIGGGVVQDGKQAADASSDKAASSVDRVVESDNGYFAIFDGHAGTFAADWCGKKLHILLEDLIRKNPRLPLPEALDQSFTAADTHLEKLPLKNSGCTAATAVLRWEERVSNGKSTNATSSIASLPPPKSILAKPEEDTVAAAKEGEKQPPTQDNKAVELASSLSSKTAVRQRVLYTANVGDARIILCRNGKALRLSYDHKGSDESEGKRITSAGGLILNNRVNGVLAVTRALGDSYMKDLVTGHPYTTETVIQPDIDEFIIIACDGIWDVCSDQSAVDLVRRIQDPTLASKKLVDHALNRFSTDNLSCMIVRFDKAASALTAAKHGPAECNLKKTSEVDKIVSETKKLIADGAIPPIGVSATNSGRGYEPDFIPTSLEDTLEEEWVTDDDEEQEAGEGEGEEEEEDAEAQEGESKDAATTEQGNASLKASKDPAEK